MVQKLKQVWGEYEIPLNKMISWSIGDLKIWCVQEENELKIAYKHMDPEKRKSVSKVPNDIKWNRWALSETDTKIRITPVMPDRPVVVEPENHFRLIVGMTAKIYIRVPIWVKLQAIGKKKIDLIDIPSIILSNTWFGSFFEGELCYWISSGARREIEPSLDRPYMAITPVQLINKSEEEFLVEKLCIRVPNLSLFYSDSQLWTDEMKLFYRGKHYVSEIEVGVRSPGEAGKTELISAPRKALKKTIAAQSFASLKDLPGLGFFVK
jgi:hypothetical protein